MWHGLTIGKLRMPLGMPSEKYLKLCQQKYYRLYEKIKYM